MLFNNNEKQNSKIPFEKVRQFVYKIIRKRIPNTEDAEDITQNVLYRGWRSTEKNSGRLDLTTDEDFLKYFSVIAFNEIKRFQSKKLNKDIQFAEEELLLLLAADQLCPEYALEIIETICQLPLKQRLVLILGQRMLIISFHKVFSLKVIAEMLEISESLLEKLANEIPLEDHDIKYVLDIIIEKKSKTTVRDERWKARKTLESWFNRR